MRILWTVVKVLVALAIAIPLSLIVLTTALGILGAFIGLAVLALKIAVFVLVCWAMLRLGQRLFGGGPRGKKPAPPSELPPADPHYDAAMRELDRELGEVSPSR